MVGHLVADGRAVGEAIVGARKLSIAGGALFLWLATTAIVVVFVVILRQMFCLLLYLACAGFSVALIASTTIRITIAAVAYGTHLWLADTFFRLRFVSFSQEMNGQVFGFLTRGAGQISRSAPDLPNLKYYKMVPVINC